MKQFKKGLSLILSLALLLSMAYLAPAEPAYAAASDYIASTYAANLSVETTASTKLMSYPTTSSTTKYTLSSGTTLSVKALHKNTSGTYWYEVSYSGSTLYVDATTTSLVSHITSDVTATNLYSPACLGVGDSFPIGGTITSTINELGTITVAMYRGSNISGTPALQSSDTASGNSYTLDSSTIDYNLAFGSLSEDDYTYAVSAEAISYYINDSGALTKSSKTVILEKKACIINDVVTASNATAFGVDVSYAQGNIDWATVATQVDFAIIRASWEYTTDEYFYQNANGCTENGIPFGVYVYSYAESVSEAVAEAEYVLSIVEGYDLALPIYFDYEDEKYLASVSNKTEICKAFCDTISEAGYQPGIYSMLSWFNSYFTDSYFDTLPKWVAHVGTSTCGYTEGVRMWQYSWTGSVSGINSTGLDVNYYYGDFPTTSTSSAYTSQCTFYPSHCQFQTTKSTTIYTQPTSSSTYSEALETVASGTTCTAIGMYQNTGSNFWYQVETSSGQTGYIYAGHTTYVKDLTSDITLTGYDTPNGHVAGTVFYVNGEIESSYNQLDTAAVYIHSGFGTSGDTVTGSSDSVSKNYYNLYNSNIDYNTAFNSIAAGNYTYAISATYTNYYAKAAQTLGTNTGTKYLCEEYFVVVPSSVDQSTCSHSYTYTVIGDNVVSSCSTCGYVTQGACSHSYSSWVTTKAATCTTDGSKTRSCSICGNTETETIAATGHSYSSVSYDATCQEYAKICYTCSKCGDSYTTYADEASEWQTTKPTGVDESLIETKTQYRYSDYETTTSYATSLSGYTLKSTSWEQSGTGTINYVSSWPSGFDTSNSLYTQYNNTKKTASTTTTAKTTINSDEVVGYLYYHWCAGTYTEGPINRATSATKADGYTAFHAFYSTTNPSTLTASSDGDGSYTYANADCCTDSHWYYYVPVYAQTYTTYKALFTYERWTDYSEWSDTAVTSSSTRQVETRTLYRYVNAELGDHVWDNGTCTVCGAADPNASPFTLAGSNMVLGGILEMNFFINQTDISGTGYYAVITHYAANGTRTVTVPYSEWGTYGPYYMVTLEDLEARQMADKIEVVIYKTDGTKASETWTDSVRDYSMRTYAARTEEGKTLLVDMLNYGAAAQTFFSYNATDLANNQLTTAQQAYATSSVSCTDQRSYGSNYVGSTLVLESRIILTVLFQDLTSDMYAVVSYTDHYGESKTVRVEGSDFVSYYSYYGIQVDDLVVADGNQLVTVTICNANGTPVAWASDSMNSYAARNLSKDPIYEMVAKFTASAYAYFH